MSLYFSARVKQWLHHVWFDAKNYHEEGANVLSKKILHAMDKFIGDNSVFVKSSAMWYSLSVCLKGVKDCMAGIVAFTPVCQ